MAGDPEFVLDLWRTLGAAPSLADGVERVLPVIAGHLPLDMLLVRHLEMRGLTVETLAAAFRDGRRQPPRPRSELSPGALQRLLVACQDRRARAVLRTAADDPLAAAVPDGAEGEILMGPL